ncbi:MAG: SHOCT domain-containing protein [Candidatus Microthrix sp.]|uniref:SHOCT domain-containing protein n=1 Tax=Candidatus Neomicrothrix subdominans TaxID=2954438 RepID=A0A936NAU0_9ACTN|nr:SHOCT domain-containing protein [Candidatus Microthrix subdominans]
MITPGAAGVGAPLMHGGPQKDPVELLSQLVAMKDLGLLTEAEFAEQRARILGE